MNSTAIKKFNSRNLNSIWQVTPHCYDIQTCRPKILATQQSTKKGVSPPPPPPPMAALTKQKAIYLKTECNLLLTILIRFTSTLNEWNRSIEYLQICWPSIKDCEMSIGSKVLLRFTGLWKFSPCSSAIASSSVDRGVEGASSSQFSATRWQVSVASMNRIRPETGRKYARTCIYEIGRELTQGLSLSRFYINLIPLSVRCGSDKAMWFSQGGTADYIVFRRFIRYSITKCNWVKISSISIKNHGWGYAVSEKIHAWHF